MGELEDLERERSEALLALADDNQPYRVEKMVARDEPHNRTVRLDTPVEMWWRNPHRAIPQVTKAGYDKYIYTPRGLSYLTEHPYYVIDNAVPQSVDWKLWIVKDDSAYLYDRTCKPDSLEHMTFVHRSPVWRGNQDPNTLVNLCRAYEKSGWDRIFVASMPKYDIDGARARALAFDYVHRVGAAFPNVKLHLCGEYADRIKWGLNFAAADVDPARTALAGMVSLPNGLRASVFKKNVLRHLKWIHILGFSARDLDTLDGRIMFNVHAALWMAENYGSSAALAITKNKREVTDPLGLFPGKGRNYRDGTRSPVTARITPPKLDPDVHPQFSPDPNEPYHMAQPITNMPFIPVKPRKDTTYDKILCNSCSLAPKCRYFRDGGLCILPGTPSSSLARLFQTRDADQIRIALSSVLAHTADRLTRVSEEWDKEGPGEIDTDEVIKRSEHQLKLENSLARGAEAMIKILDPSQRQNSTIPAITAGTVNVYNPQILVADVVKRLEQAGIKREDIDPNLIVEVAREKGMIEGVTTFTEEKFRADVAWLIDNPEFEERPPSLWEFCGPDYLNIRKHLRKRVAQELIEIFGDEFIPGHIARYSQALITGGIGIGKTTIASIVLTYMACCTLCLKDPQDYYDLLPGSAIAFMQMSTKASQALDVIFHDTKARIDNSKWFSERYPRNKALKNKIEFLHKNINIIPGDSLETTFEGYNVLGGVLDEMDSHKKTLTKDYAEAGYSTIHARITSRFGDRGFLLLIGQMKSEGGFAMRKYDEFMGRDDTYAVKLAIWESLDADKFCGEVFYYDVLRSSIVMPDEAIKRGISTETLLRIPVEYLTDFRVDPDKALRDLAGIPPKVSDPFIRNVDKVFAARERFDTSHLLTVQHPWLKSALHPNFYATDNLKRYGHIDIAYSGETGDCAGICIGHVTGIVDTDEGSKPYIVIDLIARIRPPVGRQTELSEIRQVIYDLQSRGFPIKKITLDGFQSTDTIQMFRKRHIESDLLSVDKLMLPYQDLRDAIYEGRIEFPGVFDLHKRSDAHECDVIVKELTELGYAPNGQKVDHPPGGTKDCSDALAGVVHNIMALGKWRRATSGPAAGGTRLTDRAGGAFDHVTQGRSLDEIHAPAIPNWRGSAGIASPWK